MRLLLVTDAWAPQVNGVVRTLSAVTLHLRRGGDEVRVVSPDLFRNLPCPTYPEIRLALGARRGIARHVEAFAPAAIHVATEGPLGLAARRLCRRRGLPFTTSFHTRFPEYLHARTRLPQAWTYRALRWFHAPAVRLMVATESLRVELLERGFANPALWSRGVDTELFRPQDGARDAHRPELPRPLFLCVGRVSVEKNIEAFLALDLPGTKVVVGDGPARASLAARHPEVHFTGPLVGEDLARQYAAADVFVFPSRTDTFGLVMLEALAAGVPVAAFPVQGPLDVLTDPRVGVLDEDLRGACLRALELDPADCRRHAESQSWERCAARFRALLAPFGGTSQGA